MNDIICHECGHSINKHFPNDGCFEYFGNSEWCQCKTRPSAIAAATVEQARKHMRTQTLIVAREIASANNDADTEKELQELLDIVVKFDLPVPPYPEQESQS